MKVHHLLRLILQIAGTPEGLNLPIVFDIHGRKRVAKYIHRCEISGDERPHIIISDRKSASSRPVYRENTVKNLYAELLCPKWADSWVLIGDTPDYSDHTFVFDVAGAYLDPEAGVVISRE